MAGARRVKVAGAGHSFTDIACTDGVMLDLSRMNRVLAVDGELVTVQAGITIRELGPALAARGLALENQGDADPQTIAGAVATATHGTGGRFGNISSRVEALRLVTAAGDVVELRDGDDLLAGRVSLGALGAISAVTLRCVPAFTIQRLDQPRPLDDVLAAPGRARGRERPLRAVRVPLHAHRAHAHLRARAARAAARRRAHGLPARLPARERRARARLPPRPPAAGP